MKLDRKYEENLNKVKSIKRIKNKPAKKKVVSPNVGRKRVPDKKKQIQISVLESRIEKIGINDIKSMCLQTIEESYAEKISGRHFPFDNQIIAQ